jgi:hypothetical protein
MTLPLFELDEWFASTEGRFDISLSHSGCQPLSLGELLNEGDLKLLTEVNLAYGAFDGLAERRQSIAEQYDSIDLARRKSVKRLERLFFRRLPWSDRLWLVGR